MKKTPWFKGSQKPVRPGVYERKVLGGTFSYWDGARWGASSFEAELASYWWSHPSQYQHIPWRGLLKEPK